MKKSVGFVIISIFILFGCSKKVVVPDVAKTKFASLYPAAENVKWEKEDALYEAGFKQNGNSMSALFDVNGVMTESEMEIKVSELPASATVYIETNYAGATVKGAAKITLANGEVQYEAALKNKDLIFDAAGNFLKEAKE